MLTFDPPELLSRIKNAEEVLRDVFFEPPWFLVEEAEMESYDALITLASEIEELTMYGDTSQSKITVREYLDLARELPASSLERRSIVRAPTRTIMKVEAANNFAFHLEHNRTGPVNIGLDQVVDGITYRVTLTRGSILFGAKIVETDDCDDDYNPSNSDHYLFAQVEHPEKTSSSLVDGLIQAFLFELQDTMELSLKASSVPEEFELEDVDDDYLDKIASGVHPLRPLLSGKGIEELLRLYNEAVNSSSRKLTVLGLAQVFEFVGATITRQATHRELLTRLQTPAVLNPTVGYLDLLIGTVEQIQRASKTDAGSVEQVIQACCDAVLLSNTAPTCLPTLRSISLQSRADDKRKALSELADCISATRNEMSHAKANYSRKGSECPAAELDDFIACIRAAARQAILYFARVPEDLRMA